MTFSCPNSVCRWSRRTWIMLHALHLLFVSISNDIRYFRVDCECLYVAKPWVTCPLLSWPLTPTLETNFWPNQSHMSSEASASAFAFLQCSSWNWVYDQPQSTLTNFLLQFLMFACCCQCCTMKESLPGRLQCQEDGLVLKVVHEGWIIQPE